MKIEISRLRTPDSYIRNFYTLLKFTKFCKEKKIEFFNASAVNQFISSQDIKPATRYFYRSLLMSSFKNALASTNIDSFELQNEYETVLRKVKYLTNKICKTSQGRRLGTKDLVSQEDMEKILQKNKRFGLIAEFLYNTGVRIAELTEIQLSDCIIEDNKVYIKINGKGNRIRRIFIQLHFYRRIVAFFHSQVYLFEYKNKQLNRNHINISLNRYFQRVTGKKIFCHLFRHTFITRMVKNKKLDFHQIAKWCGNSEQIIVKNYFHSEVNYADFQEAIYNSHRKYDEYQKPPQFDLQHYKEQINHLNQQNYFLQMQLKEIKNQNKILIESQNQLKGILIDQKKMTLCKSSKV